VQGVSVRCVGCSQVSGFLPNPASLFVRLVERRLQRLQQLVPCAIVAAFELAPHGIGLVRAELVPHAPLGVHRQDVVHGAMCTWVVVFFTCVAETTRERGTGERERG